MKQYDITLLKIAGVRRPHLYINMCALSNTYRLDVFGQKNKNSKKQKLYTISGTKTDSIIIKMLELDSSFKEITIDLYIDENLVKTFHLKNLKSLRLIGRAFISVKEVSDRIFLPVKEKIERHFGLSVYRYHTWIKEYEHFEPVTDQKYNPLISIVVPVYDTDPVFLRACIDSVLAQTYKNFELILVDDHSKKDEPREILRSYAEKDSRVRPIFREKNGNISEATNTGIEAARGEFIALLDNDDTLSPHALYENILALNSNRNLDLLYSDEDKLDEKGRRCDPHFKADWSPDTLLSINYITHFAVLRTSLVKKIGGERTLYNGAQDYDLFLRFSEVTTPEKIHHIPKVLYHWRMSDTSTAKPGSNAKNYASLAGKLALEDTLKRRHIRGKVSILNDSTVYTVRYETKKSDQVSILIPTKDNPDVLKRCIDSIKLHSKNSNYEIIVINNNSEKPESFAYYDELKKQGITVLDENIPFNYSRLNNIAASQAKGNYLLLLNDDTEIITDDWLDIMLGYASQSHIGAVGAKLYYQNLRVQHAGVILGLGGVAGHAYRKARCGDPGDACRLLVPYNYSAVTAACLMVKKSKYLEVGGLEEDLQVAFNDIDFCLKLLKKGYYNVFLPEVELFHYESLSRGSDFHDEKKRARFMEEISYMQSKWPEHIIRDRFYNENYSLENSFKLK